MADLKETDVEKAGKRTFRGVRLSSQQRRNLATGKTSAIGDGRAGAKVPTASDGIMDGRRQTGQLVIRDRLRSKGSFAGMKNGSYSRARELVNSRRGKLRNGVVKPVRKSSSPIETLYAEIEKARGLIPKGGSTKLRERLRVGAIKDHKNRMTSGAAMNRWLKRQNWQKPGNQYARVDNHLRTRTLRPK